LAHKAHEQHGIALEAAETLIMELNIGISRALASVLKKRFDAITKEMIRDGLTGK
jgi:hypothetical protein